MFENLSVEESLRLESYLGTGVARFAGEKKWLLPRHQGQSATFLRRFIQSLQPKKLHYQLLTARAKDAARPNTLSSRYGLHDFPLHSDFAAEDYPPSLIVLMAARPRQTKTRLFDTDELIEQFGLEYLERCLYVRNTQERKYCRLVNGTGKQLRFRYNPALMIPANQEAKAIASYIESGAKSVTNIDWTETRVAIIDNWRLLHGRESVSDSRIGALRRLSIWR